jgi:hypothetical protein
MIPQGYIREWNKYSPWKTNEQIEQDFRGDVIALLRSDYEYDIDKAYELVRAEILEKI